MLCCIVSYCVVCCDHLFCQLFHCMWQKLPFHLIHSLFLFSVGHFYDTEHNRYMVHDHHPGVMIYIGIAIFCVFGAFHRHIFCLMLKKYYMITIFSQNIIVIVIQSKMEKEIAKKKSNAFRTL